MTSLTDPAVSPEAGGRPSRPSWLSRLARGVSRLARRVAELAARRWVAVAFAAYAAGTDALIGWHQMSFTLRGVFDEPAHLATALVVLGTVARWRGRAPDWRFVTAMLFCSVAIDVDHLPAEFGNNALTSGTPRPYTHALWLVLLFTVAALAARRRNRSRRRDDSLAELVLGGAATGIAAHFLRDIATAPMAFWWPLTDASVQVPYGWYVAALVVLVILPLPWRRGRGTSRVRD